MVKIPISSSTGLQPTVRSPVSTRGGASI
jgi:hypothetical protein